MKRLSSWLMLGLVCFLALGCAKKKATPLERKQAANMVSEAQFAITVREYDRAEDLLAKATSLDPDMGIYWLRLGTTRIKRGNKSGARDAYKHALTAFQDEARQKKTDAEPALQQVYVLALLGRVDDARKLQEELVTRYPNEREVKAFVEEKRLDQVIADPQFKQAAL